MEVRDRPQTCVSGSPRNGSELRYIDITHLRECGGRLSPPPPPPDSIPLPVERLSFGSLIGPRPAATRLSLTGPRPAGPNGAALPHLDAGS